MNTQGVLYIATGEKYIHAAIRSARSVLKYCPDLPIHLFADWQSYNFPFNTTPFPFTTVESVLNPHRRSKVDYISQTPFERTLYLDTDTLLNANINSIFQILERFDLALAHAQHRTSAFRLDGWRIKIDQAFPQYNTGVILYRKTPATIRLLEEWRTCYHANSMRPDQPILRELIWLSSLRVATLPPEYNIRFIKYPLLLWSKSEAQAKIFHLKALHMGWLRWLNRKRPLAKAARMLGLGWLIDFIKNMINGRRL